MWYLKSADFKHEKKPPPALNGGEKCTYLENFERRSLSSFPMGANGLILSFPQTITTIPDIICDIGRM